MRGAVVAALLFGLGSGCPDAPAPPAPQPPATNGKTGVRVPLPEGWVATAGPDGSFLAGPRGRTVLRIDRQPASTLPTAEALEQLVRRAAAPAVVEPIERRSDDGLVMFRYRLVPIPDAGESTPRAGMIGLRALPAATFLCATLAGTSEDETAGAASACAQLALR